MERDQRQVIRILREIAREEGITLTPVSGDWILELSREGRRRYIVGYKFPNNDAAAEYICDDKAALYDTLALHGVPAVPHVYFETPLDNPYVDPGREEERRAGLLDRWGRVVAKPNRGTGGRDVYLAESAAALGEAMRKIFVSNKACAVAPYREIAHEYRAIVLNHVPRLLYEKVRPSVRGNGRDPVRTLVRDQAPGFPPAKLPGELLEEILPDGRELRLEWRHNLAQGARPVILSDPERIGLLGDLACRTTRILNVNFVSVDIIEDAEGYEILEVNGGVMMEALAGTSASCYGTAKAIYRDAVLSAFGPAGP